MIDENEQIRKVFKLSVACGLFMLVFMCALDGCMTVWQDRQRARLIPQRRFPLPG